MFSLDSQPQPILKSSNLSFFPHPVPNPFLPFAVQISLLYFMRKKGNLPYRLLLTLPLFGKSWGTRSVWKTEVVRIKSIRKKKKKTFLLISRSVLSTESLVMDLSVGQISYQQVQQAVQTTFIMARSHKPPYLDVRRCIKIVPPIKFLRLFWTELVASANLGELEACRRIATFVLTMPQDSSVCPLLPIFMHIVLPSLVAGASRQQPPEQAVTVELIVITISSVLNAALQLEWAMRSVSGDDRLVLGQLSTAMARRLAQDLRRNRGHDVYSTILQRLASSQSFVANFPSFISELSPWQQMDLYVSTPWYLVFFVNYFIHPRVGVL